ncbi:MAG: hypothetical protein ACKPKO_03755, partial [Candidatus Fonsibacter sp.]
MEEVSKHNKTWKLTVTDKTCLCTSCRQDLVYTWSALALHLVRSWFTSTLGLHCRSSTGECAMRRRVQLFADGARHTYVRVFNANNTSA